MRVPPDNWALACLSSLDSTTDSDKHEYHHERQSGQGVDVYVMDSGINENGDAFGRRVKYLPHPYLDQKDTKDHGTSVASLIGSRQFGSAKQVTLWSCNINGKAKLKDALACIVIHNDRRRREEEYKGAVLNLSLEFSIDDHIGTHLEKLEEQGIAIVIAAGNRGQDMEEFHIFAGLSHYTTYAIVVGAIDKTYARARYTTRKESIKGTNYGRRVTLFAPGKDVTGLSQKGRVVDNLDGTSYACAYVSGIVATFYGELEHMTPEIARLLLLHNAHHGALRGLDANSPNILANNGYLKAQQEHAALIRQQSRTANKHRWFNNEKSKAKRMPPFLQLAESAKP